MKKLIFIILVFIPRICWATAPTIQGIGTVDVIGGVPAATVHPLFPPGVTDDDLLMVVCATQNGTGTPANWTVPASLAASLTAAYFTPDARLTLYTKAADCHTCGTPPCGDCAAGQTVSVTGVGSDRIIACVVIDFLGPSSSVFFDGSKASTTNSAHPVIFGADATASPANTLVLLMGSGGTSDNSTTCSNWTNPGTYQGGVAGGAVALALPPTPISNTTSSTGNDYTLCINAQLLATASKWQDVKADTVAQKWAQIAFDMYLGPTPVPTATPVNTLTSTPTRTPTQTPTSTPTGTRTNTPTVSNTPTITDTPTPTATSVNTGTKTATGTATMTATETAVPTPCMVRNRDGALIPVGGCTFVEDDGMILFRKPTPGDVVATGEGKASPVRFMVDANGNAVTSGPAPNELRGGFTLDTDLTLQRQVSHDLAAGLLLPVGELDLRQQGACTESLNCSSIIGTYNWTQHQPQFQGQDIPTAYVRVFDCYNVILDSGVAPDFPTSGTLQHCTFGNNQALTSAIVSAPEVASLEYQSEKCEIGRTTVNIRIADTAALSTDKFDLPPNCQLSLGLDKEGVDQPVPFLSTTGTHEGFSFGGGDWAALAHISFWLNSFGDCTCVSDFPGCSFRMIHGEISCH